MRSLSEGGVHEEPMRPRTGLPDLVVAAPQQSDGLAQVRERFVVPSEHAQQIATPSKNSSRGDTLTVGDRPLECREPLLRPAPQPDGDTESGLDIRDPSKFPGSLGQPRREVELGHRFGLVTGVAQHDRPYLVGDRRGRRGRLPVQQGGRGRNRLGRPGQGQWQQMVVTVLRPAG